MRFIKSFICVGLITKEKKPPRQWLEQKRKVVTGELSNVTSEKVMDRKKMPGEKLSLKTLKDQRSDKYMSCIHYIKYCATIFADTCPTNANIKFLPYESAAQFYAEYENFHKTYGYSEASKAKYDTFNNALKSLHDSVRLVHAKGSFPTCDVCNNANDLLRSPKVSFNPGFRDIIMKFKRAHLMRQMQEREEMERNIIRAKTEVIGHQPQVAHLLCDAISSWRGNTPKVGGGDFRISKADQIFIENRVMAVEMVCGPVDCVRLYHSNNLVSGGANYMITVLKQALEDLAEMLAEKGYTLPPELILNFDNCGENKNQFMFAYNSVLVELCLFKVIQINFLIVGHTHCSVDRMFGRFSDKIRAAYFIASPLALRKLLIDSIQRPVYNKEIISVYDWKAFLQPYINNRIKYYSIPHNFRISLHYHKAVYQYRLYSNFDWLPVRPWQEDFKSSSELERREIFEVQLVPFSIVGGEANLIKTIGAEWKDPKSLLPEREQLQAINQYSAHREIFASLESNALHQQIQRHQDECNGLIDSYKYARYKTKQSEARTMLMDIVKKYNTEETGYMWWIIEPQDYPPIYDGAPKLIYTREMVESVFNSLSTNRSTSDGVMNVAIDDGLYDETSSSVTSKLHQAMRNITAAARLFIKNSTSVAQGGMGKFKLNRDLGKLSTHLRLF